MSLVKFELTTYLRKMGDGCTTIINNSADKCFLFSSSVYYYFFFFYKKLRDAVSRSRVKNEYKTIYKRSRESCGYLRAPRPFPAVPLFSLWIPLLPALPHAFVLPVCTRRPTTPTRFFYLYDIIGHPINNDSLSSLIAYHLLDKISLQTIVSELFRSLNVFKRSL